MAPRQNKGQHLVEFIICTSVVAMAVSGMAIYVQRSLQSRLHGGLNHIVYDKLKNASVSTPNPYSGLRKQYDPDYRVSADARYCMGANIGKVLNIDGRTVDCRSSLMSTPGGQGFGNSNVIERENTGKLTQQNRTFISSSETVDDGDPTD